MMRVDYSFSEPTITPFTKKRCRKGYTQMIGVTMMMTNVMRSYSGVVPDTRSCKRCWLPCNKLEPAPPVA